MIQLKVKTKNFDYIFIHSCFLCIGSSLHQALLSLDDAEKKLKQIVNIKFDQAVEIGHLPEAMRFFKIFPLLNLHQIGLEKFCKHLCLQINDHGDKMLKKTLEIPFNHKRYPVLYSDYLTSLFEYIADIVETYQPLVETYYGEFYKLIKLTLVFS